MAVPWTSDSYKVISMKCSLYFMPGRTTGSFFIVSTIKYKYRDKMKTLFWGFAHIEKAFGKVPCEKLCIEIVSNESRVVMVALCFLDSHIPS